MTQSTNVPESDHLLVMTTTAGSITAKKIANELVEKRMASCVQILPSIHSVFRWKGRIEHQEEHLILIKTARTCYSSVESIIKGLHPYEVPEIIALPIVGGLPEYLAWISQTADALSH